MVRGAGVHVGVGATTPHDYARSLRRLFDRVDNVRDDEDKWCSPEKAHHLAALVVALKPSVVVEIGVWRGASVLPMLVGLAFNRDLGITGHAYAIDPWDADASTQGESAINAAWWAAVDHERARVDFLHRLEKSGLADLCNVVRARSDNVTPPDHIGLLHVDGSHTEQAIRDVARFAPNVTGGGIMVLDDIGWEGDHVHRARDNARELGFVEIYPLAPGVVMQRKRVSP